MYRRWYGPQMRIPTPWAFTKNWRSSDLPFAEKLRLATSNQMIKLRKGTSCCGNYGEPGC